ncbi:MAG TPA: cell division protein FtsA [Thermotogae bacterium]|nr:cell division protein FtsA [Thermotogota bacterium]
MKRLSIDVGTRTIVGICSELEDGRLRVLEAVTMEHEERAMLDGAIHDIDKVAKVVRRVKESIESRTGETFESADVALAGRFLQTVVGEAVLRFDRLTEITDHLVKHLEALATRDAVSRLKSEREMYCVGYSPLFYTIDGEWVKNPAGHRVSEVYAKVMATFLPRQTVDSMVLALKKAGLHVGHLTLEPIAVLELLVPQDLRLLNLVILDVGAGTSDIAVSRDGMVIGYAMIPSAGDEITEKICKEYLLDFPTAELVKRELGKKELIMVKDVLGFDVELKSTEVLRTIRPVVEEIVSDVAEEIVSLNGKPPAAVLVVGGGAKVPGFIEALSSMLNLPQNRVSLRTVETLSAVEDLTGNLQGSEYITPVAIAMAGHSSVGGVFISVTLNGKPVQLLPLGEKRTVLDLLIQNGYNLGDFIARPAPSIVYELNGEMRIHKGSRGKDAPVYINGKEASLRSFVEHGDEIVVGSPEDGEIKPLRIKDVVPPVVVEYEGKTREFYPPVMVNGSSGDPDMVIEDSMKIEYPRVIRVKDVLKGLPGSRMDVWIDGQNVTLEVEEYHPVNKDVEDVVEPGERLVVAVKRKEWRVKDLVELPDETITVVFNGESVELPVTKVVISSNGDTIDMDTPVEDGMVLETRLERRLPLVVDLLARRTIDLSKVKDYRILVNGEPAEFTKTLNDGDEVIFEYMESV